MVEAKHVRIDNIVLEPGGKHCLITRIDETSYPGLFVVGERFQKVGTIVTTPSWEQLLPVSLSRTWLERLGFEMENTYKGANEIVYEKEFLDGSSNIFIKKVSTDAYSLALYNEEKVGGDWFDPYGGPFQFVHQLQNLYFALTGQELKINHALA